MRPFSQGIPLKKQFGQHFLRDQSIVDSIVRSVDLNDQSSVFEIGCGDGFLTRTILQAKLARLWVFEIDADWVDYMRKSVTDKRAEIFEENILDVDFARFEPNAPWTLLANLPYQITFPILHMLKANRLLLKEGVIMVQEEVAQKILKSSGRGYGFPSLYFQHFFEWRALDKIAPTAFFPPPKVYSRLLYFKPKKDLVVIPDEENFWKFIKVCFRQPRRTLRNNLAQTHYAEADVPEEFLILRAQQLDMDDLLKIWDSLSKR
ncbi:MAG: 16S rRNA (adenine(1518)-N(6)/adenine(1519)-N(6))-dimethyltransferase RsmA [Candidatus Dependentiae bacterium]|nr:16S rRNA (adenine(1518)-N(6)/adenine(1519)-N(6))-dimethyltransferase RsmA [Candidatus Dependentiae bacterium]